MRFRGYARDGWLWVIVPKAASTSIKLAIIGGPERGVHKRMVAQRYTDANLESFWSFAVVRNPWNRLVSAWASKINKPKIRDMLSRMGCYPFMPFAEFIEVVARTKPSQRDAHVGPQKVPSVDFIGHVETLGKDWPIIMAHTGLPSLSRGNRSTHNRPERYKTPELVKIVNDVYGDEFERYGYATLGV